MLFVVLLCTVLFLCAFLLWKSAFKQKHVLPPVLSRRLPIVGHLHLVIGDRITLWTTTKEAIAETTKLGGVSCAFFGPYLYYFITDPDDALTASNECLQKHFIYDFAKPWMGDGLITASGETWKRHRKLLMPAFGLPVMLGFIDIFNSQARLLVKSLKKEVGNQFNHIEYLRHNALETFCLTAFGISCFDDENFTQKYMNACDNILRIITIRFQKFWLQNDFIFKLSSLKKEHDEFVRIVHDTSDKVIKKKIAARNNHVDEYATKSTGVRYKPLLDLLLELTEDDALTDREIREEVDTAIMAGFDTTSTVLSLVMMFLGSHPRAQEKIYTEDVEREDFEKLVYMEAVIKESLRVMTAGPATLRYVDKDVKWKNCTMRAGSQCLISLWGVHHHTVWGNDVEEFRPERWLNDTPDNPASFVGFSLGKRSCLGKIYAMLSMKTTLVHFLRRYKVTSDMSNLQVQYDFILKPVSGYEISIEERNQ